MYENPPIKRKLLKEKYDDLLKFVHNYMQTHVFVSKVMVSGLYITKRNPKHNFVNGEVFRKATNKRVSMIFDVYKKLGVCERYGKNVVKINRAKLKHFSLDDVRNYAYKN